MLRNATGFIRADMSCHLSDMKSAFQLKALSVNLFSSMNTSYGMP